VLATLACSQYRGGRGLIMATTTWLLQAFERVYGVAGGAVKRDAEVEG
jgi:hypothetical protein